MVPTDALLVDSAIPFPLMPFTMSVPCHGASVDSSPCLTSLTKSSVQRKILEAVLHPWSNLLSDPNSRWSLPHHYQSALITCVPVQTRVALRALTTNIFVLFFSFAVEPRHSINVFNTISGQDKQ